VLPGCNQWPAEVAERYRREGYWRGESLADLLRHWSRVDGDRVAIVSETRQTTYRRLDAWADRIAGGLQQLGIRRHDRVVVQLPNIVEFAALSVALFRIGALPVFALPSHRRSEIKYLCEYSEAVAYVIPDIRQRYDYRALAADIRTECPRLRHVLVVGDPGEFVALGDVDGTPAPSPSDPGDVAFFLLSGGTTGAPKLIPRTHDDYAYQLRATAEGLRFGDHGVYLAALPIAHNAALGCPGLLGTLRAGGKVVLAETPSPDEVFPLIVREQVTLTTLMPPLVSLWIETAQLFHADLSRVIVQVGGAKLSPVVARQVRTELGSTLTHWFGMAEGLLSFTRLSDPEEIVVHTQGHPLCPADEIRVVDDRDQDVESGQLGQLLTRGPYTLRGYYRAPDYNATVFTTDGYLRTGDLVRIDSGGNMVVEGRTRDTINRGGEKIAAGEVEEHLRTHPDIRDAAVLPVPDAVLGEKTCAFVVCRDAQPVLGDIRRFLTERGVAEYKIPDRVEPLAALPRTPLGKVNKAALRDMIGGS
jgi:2,3-dihydroxybenzoate-AMP ligase